MFQDDSPELKAMPHPLRHSGSAPSLTSNLNIAGGAEEKKKPTHRRVSKRGRGSSSRWGVAQNRVRDEDGVVQSPPLRHAEAPLLGEEHASAAASVSKGTRSKVKRRTDSEASFDSFALDESGSYVDVYYEENASLLGSEDEDDDDLLSFSMSSDYFDGEEEQQSRATGRFGARAVRFEGGINDSGAEDEDMNTPQRHGWDTRRTRYYVRWKAILSRRDRQVQGCALTCFCVCLLCFALFGALFLVVYDECRDLSARKKVSFAADFGFAPLQPRALRVELERGSLSLVRGNYSSSSPSPITLPRFGVTADVSKQSRSNSDVGSIHVKFRNTSSELSLVTTESISGLSSLFPCFATDMNVRVSDQLEHFSDLVLAIDHANARVAGFERVFFDSTTATASTGTLRFAGAFATRALSFKSKPGSFHAASMNISDSFKTYSTDGDVVVQELRLLANGSDTGPFVSCKTGNGDIKFSRIDASLLASSDEAELSFGTDTGNINIAVYGFSGKYSAKSKGSVSVHDNTKTAARPKTTSGTIGSGTMTLTVQSKGGDISISFYPA